MDYGRTRQKISNIQRNVLPHDSPYWWNGQCCLMVQRVQKAYLRHILFHREPQADLEVERKICKMAPQVIETHTRSGIECRFNDLTDIAYQVTGAMDIYVPMVLIDYMNYLWKTNTHWTLADGCTTVALWSGPVGSTGFNGFVMTHNSPELR